MINDDFIEEEKTEQPLSKTQLVKILFDKNNPEMITYLQGNEIDKISMLSVLTQEENELRGTLDLKFAGKNPMQKLVKKHLVLRTSIKGTRAEQGVKIITSALSEEEQQDNNNLSQNLKRVLKG